MKLEGWKENLISKAGKETLIKAVTQAIPQYAMSIFKLPISICQSTKKRIAAFWWKNSESRSGFHWTRWQVLKTRKDKGVMGFKDLRAFNKAMLRKQAWRLSQNHSSLRGQILKGIYFPTRSIWHAGRGFCRSWG